MKIYITLLCYMNGEIITWPNGVCYYCPSTKVIVMNTDATFGEFEENVCQSLSIDHLQINLVKNEFSISNIWDKWDY